MATYRHFSGSSVIIEGRCFQGCICLLLSVQGLSGFRRSCRLGTCRKTSLPYPEQVGSQFQFSFIHVWITSGVYMKGSSSQWLVLSPDEANCGWALFYDHLSSVFFGGNEWCFLEPTRFSVAKSLLVIRI